ncbi:MAG: hypothetical protein IJV18_09985, partial [Acidaminococcaceae bacterium]|nr:hypothetical protein [Acidaminococcaceae bacterium]
MKFKFPRCNRNYLEKRIKLFLRAGWIIPVLFSVNISSSSYASEIAETVGNREKYIQNLNTFTTIDTFKNKDNAIKDAESSQQEIKTLFHMTNWVLFPSDEGEVGYIGDAAWDGPYGDYLTDSAGDGLPNTFIA